VADGGALLLLPLALIATSCFWGDESETRQITGNYYLNGESDEDPWYIHFADEKWGLADALINTRIAEAGFSEKCIVLRAARPSAQFYVIPLGKAADVESRDEVRHKIIGPLSKTEFQTAVRQLNNGALVPFDAELTAF
jgi:hypothetical protein